MLSFQVKHFQKFSCEQGVVLNLWLLSLIIKNGKDQTYSGSCQTCQMDLFAKTVNRNQLLTIFRYHQHNEQSPKRLVTEKTNLKAPVIPKNNNSPEYNRSPFLKSQTIDIIMSISSLFCPFFSWAQLWGFNWITTSVNVKATAQDYVYWQEGN